MNTEQRLKCDMTEQCQDTVNHIDDSGFIYCTKHGLQRRGHGRRCRKLRPSELKKLENGQPVTRY